MNEEMKRLRRNIMEVYDGGCWERLTGTLWKTEAEGYDLWKFERDVEFDRKTYRCIIIEQRFYDADLSIEDVDRSEDIFFDAWVL